jgi:hypothetical protein
MPPGNRLIFPFHAVVRRLDVAATVNDALLREARTVPLDLFDQAGSSQRAEGTELTIRVQVLDEDFDRLRLVANGDSPVNFVDLTTHRTDLISAGLLAVDGQPLLGKGDRLDRIETVTGELMLKIPRRPGLFIHEIRPRGWGLGIRPTRNLWFLHFRGRDTGKT